MYRLFLVFLLAVTFITVTGCSSLPSNAQDVSVWK